MVNTAHYLMTVQKARITGGTERMTKRNDNFIILHQTVQKQHSDHVQSEVLQKDKSFGFNKKADM